MTFHLLLSFLPLTLQCVVWLKWFKGHLLVPEIASDVEELVAFLNYCALTNTACFGFSPWYSAVFFCLMTQGDGVNSYYDQKEYIGRSVHYWRFVLPLLERIKKRRSIPEPLDPLFIHFPSKDIQVDTLCVIVCSCYMTFWIWVVTDGCSLYLGSIVFSANMLRFLALLADQVIWTYLLLAIFCIQPINIL